MLTLMIGFTTNTAGVKVRLRGCDKRRASKDQYCVGRCSHDRECGGSVQDQLDAAARAAGAPAGMSGETLRAMAAELSSKSPEEVTALAEQAAAAQRIGTPPRAAPTRCLANTAWCCVLRAPGARCSLSLRVY